MSCEEMKILISGLVDGEIDGEEKKMVEDHIVGCDDCRDEYSRLLRLKEVTNEMKYFDLPDRLWAQYWEGIYRRLERGTGWVLFSLGAIILMAYGAWHFLNDFLFDTSVSAVIRFGLAALVLGLIIILVSIIRERLFARKHDRYDEVEL